MGGEQFSRTVLEDGMETNNMLESFNQTWNLLSGYSPNVWHIQDQFVKQDADARQAFLSNELARIWPIIQAESRGPMMQNRELNWW